MEKFLGKILVSAVAALIASYLLSGVYIDNGFTALFAALVLALLNSFVKPLLIILTIPVTLLTLGLFLLVINMLMIKLVAEIVPGFTVKTWWAAFWFSILLSLVTALLEAVISRYQKEKK